tara:strand:+ start:4572 stop:6269 length:1698 start_codon:yes stop_codon:yes gene_type:complete
MLVTIYEEQNSAKFSAKFTTPLTLPKNAELSLLKAYIPRDHSIAITDANNHLTMYIHSKDADAKQVISIPNGTYGLEAFAKQLQLLFRSAVNVVNSSDLGQLSNMEAFVTAKLDDNQVANDALTFYLRPTTLTPNFYYEANFLATGNLLAGNVTGQKGTATDTYTLSLGDGTMRCSVYQTNAPADKTGWDNVVILDRAINTSWFSPQAQADYANNRPPMNATHGLISYKLGDTIGSTGSFMVGLNQHGSAIDLTGVTANDLSQIVNMAGISLAVVVYGDTANGKTAGAVEVFEDIAGTFTSLGNFTGFTIGGGDEVMIAIPQNSTTMDGCEYYIKFANGNIRRLGIATAHRYIPLARQVLNPVFSFFKGTGAVDLIEDLKWGMDAGYMPTALDATKGAGKFDLYGKYIKMALGGATNGNKTLGTTLGFTHDEYEQDGGGGRSHAINQGNEGDMVTNDSKQPYLNLNITNLPISSFSCGSNDPVIGASHDYSKCVASIPRFNQDDGHYDNLAIVFDDNTQSIKLNNKSEIVLSSLDCRLQNCDGSYPADLLTPSSFVFKVSGDNLN